MSAEDAESLYRISTIIHRAENALAAIGMFAEELESRFDVSYLAVVLVNPDSEDIEFEFTRGSGLDDRPRGSAAPSPSVARWSAFYGKTLRIPEFSREHRFLLDNTPSEMAAPLTGRTSPIGAALLATEQTGGFTRKEERSFARIAREASWVIEKIWEIEQLQRQSAQLESLISMGQRLVSTRELNDLLQSITVDARTIMGCRLCALFLLQEDGRMLDLQAIDGSVHTDPYRERVSLQDSAIGTAIARRKEIEVSDLARSEDHHFVAMVRREGLVSLLSAPIYIENESIGVLNAYTDGRHRFSNHEKNVLNALASLSAVAIQNARLYGRVFQSEGILRDNERLTTLGLLTAEIAHEIRNPLTVIRLLFDALDLDFDEGDARRKDAEVIIEEITRLGKIVDRVLSFGKQGEGIHTRLELNALIDDTFHLMRLKLDQSRIRAEIIPSKRPLPLEGSKGQLQQVILNLVINAMQAMPEGGEIRIETAPTGKDAGDRALFTITDTGLGVPEQIQHSIFDSFLSGYSEGSGLGLAIAKRILNSHRGDIELLHTSKDGTTVQFWLPLAP
jgi:signal transduction histidine kinase